MLSHALFSPPNLYANGTQIKHKYHTNTHTGVQMHNEKQMYTCLQKKRNRPTLFYLLLDYFAEIFCCQLISPCCPISAGANLNKRFPRDERVNALTLFLYKLSTGVQFLVYKLSTGLLYICSTKWISVYIYVETL